MTRRRICAYVLTIAAFAATPALAQTSEHAQHHAAAAATPAGGATSGMMQGMAGGAGMPMMGMMRMMMGQAADMTEHVEGRLAFMKAELKITDAQLTLWSKFAQAVRENAKAMGGMMQGGGMMRGSSMMGITQSGSLPERLALRERMLTAHLEALRRLKAAVDPLYAALSAEQKKTADELMLSPVGMM
jgi:hypothetical protein